MLLTMHIGNTEIALGVHDNEGANPLLFRAVLSSKPEKTADEYAVLLGQIFSLHSFDARTITAVVVSSVVPSLTDTVVAAAAYFTAAKVYRVGSGMKTGLRIRIDNPAQLGADLCASAFGASVRAAAQGSTRPIVIASFDTATALTVMTSPDEIAGVVIMPGVASAARALERDTALLTDIALDPPRRVIGKNTQDALRSGLLIGCAAQIDGMLMRIAEELGCQPADMHLFAFGKYADRVVSLCENRFESAPHLLFEGLVALYRKNR